MPRKNGQLTRTEVAFIEAFTLHGDRVTAEKKAGIAPRSGYAILSRPEIQQQIIAQQTARLTSDALPLAVKTLCDIMQDTKAPAGARVQAAKTVLDRVLPTDADGRRKEIHELTPEELAASIAALEGQAAALARPIDDAPGEGAFG